MMDGIMVSKLQEIHLWERKNTQLVQDRTEASLKPKNKVGRSILEGSKIVVKIQS